MPFIRYVRVAEPGTDNEHVVEVRHSAITTGPLRSESIDAIHTAIRRGTPFRTFNERNHNQRDVAARITPTGARYIAAIDGGRETDDLLRLPRY
ncbi:DUF3892 domain-containing protein [Antribacter gilvus]|uniref:DUF3892 domain-containing protein n=1 Tax=Antribacter gilvus TaxID=2304675 RepID=UPI000F7B9B57|nr:DUF3892 domain-containing protein [Antribacter gilvus]